MKHSAMCCLIEISLVGMMVLGFDAGPIRAGAAPNRATARPGYPEHARLVHERLYARSAATRVAASRLAPAGADGEWLHPGIPGLAEHVAIYDPGRDRMLVFGGYDNFTPNDDLWSLSMTAPNPWSKVPAGGTPPPPGAAIYDPVRNRILILAGWAAGEGVNDVWTMPLTGAPLWTQMVPTGEKPDIIGPVVYDSSRDRLVIANGGARVFTLSLAGTPAWAELTAGGTGGGTGDGPGERTLPVAIYDPIRDRLVMFGGETDIDLPRDVWTLPFSGELTWTALQTNSALPEGRVAATALYDPVNDRMVLYAGSYLHDNFSDAWSLSLGSSTAWTFMGTLGPIPYKRSAHTAVYDSKRQRMVIFSGYGFINGPPDRNDVWALALTGQPAWTPVRGTSPEPRTDHAAVYDRAGDRMLMFGGYSWTLPANYRGEVWSYSLGNSPTWTQLHPTGDAPTTRSPIALVDGAKNRVIVIGGSDVWSLTLRAPATWTKLDPRGTAPPSIHSAIMDPRGHRVIALTEADNSAWELSLSNNPKWTLIEAIADEPIPGGSEAIYDGKRDRLLIWGESSNEEVWALPLSSHPHWTKLVPIGPYPSPRIGYTLTYDSRRDRIVLFRGSDEGDARKPWALSLSGTPAWHELESSGGDPVTVFGHSAIYDPVRDRMVLFGGEYFYNELNEAWVLAFGGSPVAAAAAGSSVLSAYPNPFNPNVTIPFQLGNDGQTMVTIYDVAGRRVKTLLDAWTARGAHAVTWEGTSDAGERVSSGIYFCRLEAPGISRTQKLVMLK